MRTIQAHCGFDSPPEWAVLERELIDVTNTAIGPVLEQYVADDGAPLWPPEDDYAGIGGLDNLYEGFYNWPIFYLLGGGQQAYDAAAAEFDAITEHVADIPTGLGHPQVVDEYQQGYDWFHQSEGYLLFYGLCMADPTDQRHRERAQRFAGYYLNENDVELYDEDRHLLKAPHVGSMGPATRNFSPNLPAPKYHAHAEPRIPWEYEPWKERYGLPFQDVEGINTVADLQDPQKAREMGQVIRERCSEGDVAQNLAATTLVTNAYLLLGDPKYREWVTEYVTAWIERAETNGGLVPDNVGPTGEIGERIDGKWYGGWYGWCWPHGWSSLGAAIVSGATNAMLLERGDDRYLDLPRTQIDHLLGEAIRVDGLPHLPHRHGDPGTYSYDRGPEVLRDEDGDILWRGGWFEFRPQSDHNAPYPTHLWYLSMADEDRNRLAELRGDRDWDVSRTGRKDRGGHEYEWLAFLEGEFPDYPEAILSKDLGVVTDYIEFAREEDQDSATYSEIYLQHRNPVAVEGLVQCTMGAPQQVYNGGLQFGQVRHFDPENERPGLPPGVAALVTSVERTSTTLELVNLGAVPREVVVQAGGFAEHRFGTTTYSDRIYAFDERPYGYDMETTDPTRTVDIDDDAFRVRMAGASRIRLELTTERFVNDPTYAFPWNR